MRIYATVPIRVSAGGAIRYPRSGQCRIAGQRSLLNRLRRFVESDAWEKKWLSHSWIDGACLGVITLSTVYFVPLLISLLLK